MVVGGVGGGTWDLGCVAGPRSARLHLTCQSATDYGWDPERPLTHAHPPACPYHRDLVAFGVIEPLLELLEKGKDAGRKGAARALARMGDEPMVADKMCSPGSLLRLLRAAVAMPGPSQRVLSGLLERLLTTERGARALPTAQSVPPLLRLLEADAEPGTHERVARALAAVCGADESGFPAMVADQSGFAALLSRLQLGSPELRKPLLHLVFCLTARRQDQQALLRSGVVQALLALFKGGHGQAVTDVVSKALENLSQPASSILERSLSDRRTNNDGARAAASAADVKGDAAAAANGQLADLSVGDGQKGAAARPQAAPAPAEQQQDKLLCSMKRATSGNVVAIAAAAVLAAAEGEHAPERPVTPTRQIRTGAVAAAIAAVEGSKQPGTPPTPTPAQRGASPRAPSPSKARPSSGRPSYVAAHAAAAAAAAAQAAPTLPPRPGSGKKQPQQQPPGQTQQQVAAQQQQQQQAQQQQPSQQQQAQPAAPSQQQQQPAAAKEAPAPAAAASPSPAKAPAAAAPAAAQQPPAPSPAAAAAPAADGADKGGDAAARGAAEAAGANSAGGSTAPESDDLLSSTYDNLHGLLLKKTDIRISRAPDGRKLRLGEGGFGVVYKAVMNNVDEVAVKLVKVRS